MTQSSFVVQLRVSMKTFKFGEGERLRVTLARSREVFVGHGVVADFFEIQTVDERLRIRGIFANLQYGCVRLLRLFFFFFFTFFFFWGDF